tara:strand:+ start:1080 stop:1295 length:216 start_codon:yes stop_codon:yes gene_type:complete
MIKESVIDYMIDELAHEEKKKPDVKTTELRNKLIKIQGIKVHSVEPPKNISKSDREIEYNRLKAEFDKNFR